MPQGLSPLLLCFPYMADGIPSTEELERSEVRVFDSSAGKTPTLPPGTSKESGTIGKKGGDSSGEQSLSVGAGLLALPKKTVERIRANEYIDFAELPPAKGKGRPVPHSLEGQVIVVQAADLIQSRKIIPDFATWSQCFALYVATLATHQLEQLTDLMAYQSLIAKASIKFKWPSWVVYDQNFRQEAAGNPDQLWGKADPSLYAQCFTGQAVSAENWCSKCQCLDHTSADCPFRSRKRAWSSAIGPQGGKGEQQICQNSTSTMGTADLGRSVGSCMYAVPARIPTQCLNARRGLIGKSRRNIIIYKLMELTN